LAGYICEFNLLLPNFNWIVLRAIYDWLYVFVGMRFLHFFFTQAQVVLGMVKTPKAV
jgi:hypothetical protein